MKRIACVLLLVLMVGGCSGVIMNAEYSQLLDRAAVLSSESVRRYEAGQLDPNETLSVLQKQAQSWRQLQDARDGRESK